MPIKKSSDPATRSLFIEPKDNTGVFRVGTSGWSYPPGTGPGSWTGVFYPLSRTDELKFYSRYFNAVEVNSTFYRPCAPKTAESWAKRTPEDFEFTVKAWQQFTHKKGEWTVEEVEEFKRGIFPLAEATKLTIYVGRGERVAGRPAFLAVVDLLHRHGVDGATVLLGVDGTAHGVRQRAALLAATPACR